MGNDEPLETEQASEAPRPSKASRAEKRAAGNKGEKGKRGKGRKASDDDAAEARQRASDDADDNADDNASDDADEGSAQGEAREASDTDGGDGAGDLYRPPFARRYPRDPELDRLLRAFVEGNNALVFREAPELAKKTDDKAVARAALDLHQRLKPDPLAAAMLAGAGLLLLFLVLWFYTHRHGH